MDFPLHRWDLTNLLSLNGLLSVVPAGLQGGGNMDGTDIVANIQHVGVEGDPRERTALLHGPLTFGGTD
jgi:hypothetical protein